MHFDFFIQNTTLLFVRELIVERCSSVEREYLGLYAGIPKNW